MSYSSLLMSWGSLMFNNPSSNLMETVEVMHDYAVMFLLPVSILVLCLFIFTSTFKYVDRNFSEHEGLEMVWTIVPFIILFSVAIPSLKSLYLMDNCMFCGLTLSVMGHQWYWSYFYKDTSMDYFDSYMAPSSEAMVRLLEVDNALVLPSLTPIRMLISSSDVIHSWTVPSLGVKMDAVPGRLNQICFLSKRSGVFFGQCSEICGANHSFMPIVLEFVPFNEFCSL